MNGIFIRKICLIYLGLELDANTGFTSKTLEEYLKQLPLTINVCNVVFFKCGE